MSKSKDDAVSSDDESREDFHLPTVTDLIMLQKKYILCIEALQKENADLRSRIEELESLLKEREANGFRA